MNLISENTWIFLQIAFLTTIIFIYTISLFFNQKKRSKQDDLQPLAINELESTANESWVKRYTPSSQLLKPLPCEKKDIFLSEKTSFKENNIIEQTTFQPSFKKNYPVFNSTYKSQPKTQEKDLNFKLTRKKYSPSSFQKSPSNSFQSEDFQFEKKLGVGSQGEVWLVQHILSKKKYAIKVIHKTNNCLETNNLISEVFCLSKLSHPNILRFFGTFEFKNNKALVLEYAARGSLANYIIQGNSLSESKVSKIVYQILLAVEYLHSNKIIHRDIKPSNLFFDEYFNIKLGDFGCATYLTNQTEGFFGTLDYLSPEMIKQISYGKEVDIWAIGIVSFELLTGKPPYENPEKTEMEICAQIINQIPKFPSYLSKDAINFLSKTIVLDPRFRAPISILLNHTWFKNNHVLN